MKKTYVPLIVLMSLIITISTSPSALGYGGGPEPSSSGKYSVEVVFDKEVYVVGDAITISGNVNKYDEDRQLRIVIFDQDRKMVVNEKISVNPDRTFSYDLTSNTKLSEGEHSMRVQYGASKTNVHQTSFVINSGDSMPLQKADTEIPSWVRSNAGWWADGTLDDDSFVTGIQFLIEEEILQIPLTSQGSTEDSSEIPSWVRSNAGWWADGTLDDDSFVTGIQFLIEEGFMRISI